MAATAPPLVWRVLDRVVAVVTALHVRLYRGTAGRLGHRLPGMPTILLLDHVGARSGRRRTTPLLYTAVDDDLVLIASKAGAPRHPAWLHNLRAHPEVTVQVRDEVHAVRAREAGPAERDRLWALAVRTYPTYDSYRARTDRQIPVVVLSPRG
ncbi:nitroreductase family deazaflavin-dependent oxidoreductase [Actinomycetospora atypica]|uniref:Nitroreductase family deazaflavin-dependent oxidoreductase n=1 Tax=Actinomycetospora atypica TaxID=1290095 RepID=A0ABV9YPN7_9PSEU